MDEERPDETTQKDEALSQETKTEEEMPQEKDGQKEESGEQPDLPPQEAVLPRGKKKSAIRNQVKLLSCAEDRPPIKCIIECLLFVSEVSLNPKRIAELADISVEDAVGLARELMQEYDQSGHSFKIVEIAEGFQMCTRHEYAPWIKLLYASRNRAILSRAALETLSIIAYKQPITRVETETVRGVDCSGVLNTLLEKKLIKISGRKKVLGRPLLYRTTDEFLVYFGLRDLSELPKVEELRGIV